MFDCTHFPLYLSTLRSLACVDLRVYKLVWRRAHLAVQWAAPH